jgi:hypothetical protein
VISRIEGRESESTSIIRKSTRNNQPTCPTTDDYIIILEENILGIRDDCVRGRCRIRERNKEEEKKKEICNLVNHCMSRERC